MPLYIAFIDLTKAFDLVSRDGIFKVLPKIGCPLKLQTMSESFHTDTKETVLINDSSSKPFEIRSGVKQGCVLAPTLFGVCRGSHQGHAVFVMLLFIVMNERVRRDNTQSVQTTVL